MPTFIGMRCVLFLVIALGGCASDLPERDASKCRDYGFQPGTDAYSSCLMNQDQTRRMIGAAMILQ